MDTLIAKKLIDLNQKFYNQFGTSFSATRQKLQPGVQRILDSIGKNDSVLDIGCGNGLFLRTLAQRGHQSALLGVDFSLPMLREAGSADGVAFQEVELSVLRYQLSMESGKWDVVTMFATLHHIPSNEIRLDILRTVKKLLKPNGKFILSNWQFLNSEKLKLRIQGWEMVGLTNQDVDEHDYLLDWRSGGAGLRYAHHFSANELLELAHQVELRVEAQFLSDGENGKLGLYQIWKHA